MLSDLRFALRALLRSPVFTVVSILMLAVGIGLSIFMFGAINVYSLRPLPFDRPEQLVHVQYTDAQTGQRNLSMPLLDWQELRGQQQSLEGLAGYSVGTMNLGGLDAAPERLSGAWVSADAFTTLGVQPQLGRPFADSDSAAGAAPVALIGQRLWQLHFNADPGVLGREVRINGTPTTIIGVMPERFTFPMTEAIWLPLSSDRVFAGTDAAPLVNGFGRLRAGISTTQAREDLGRLMAAMAAERSAPLRGDAIKLVALADHFILPQMREANTVMFVAVLLVLLIACANVASLVLGRFAERTRELAVRSALGASRGRLIVQVLAETLVVASIATVVGWYGADLAARLMRDTMATTPVSDPYWIDYSSDLRDVMFAAGIAVVAAVAAGLGPALRAGRIDAQAGLKQGQGIGTRTPTSRFLVIGEVALCLALLGGAGVAIRSAISAQQVKLGIHTENILTGRIKLPDASYADANARLAFAEQLLPRLEALPGVDKVAFASTLPLMGYERQGYARVDDVIERDTQLAQAWASSVSDGFFDVFGIALREGRLFDAGDRADSTPVAIISAKLANAAWPGESAIGKRLRLSPRDADSPWLQVVGVVEDSVQADYLETASTIAAHRGDGNVFRPLRQQAPGFLSVAVHAQGDVAALAPALRDAVRAVDADQPVYWLRTMEEWRQQLFWGSDILAKLFTAFGLFALLLAVAGIYAVLSFDVSRRTREIGVRRALGASAGRVLGMVLRRGGRQALVGIAIGLPLAMLFGAALSGLMMPGSSADPRVYLVIVATLLGASVLAAIIPARRALRVDPMVALRDE